MSNAISLISFTGYSPISKLWKQGKLPTVTKGIYGGTLSIENCTKEHLLPKSLGGKDTYENIALATMANNSKRANQPLSDWLTKDLFNQYVEQFKAVDLPDLNGPRYIKSLTRTIIRIFKSEGKSFE